MATVLPSVYRHALEEFEYARSTKEEDGLEYLGDLMRANQVVSVVKSLAWENLDQLLEKEKFASPELRTAHKLVQLVQDQAALLPRSPIRTESLSVENFSAVADSISENAKEGGCIQIKEQIAKLNGEKTFPRTEPEIFKMIDCMRKIQSLSRVFELCCDVESIYNPKPSLESGELALPAPPTRGKIERLKDRLKEVDQGQPFRALEVAKKQLSELEIALPKARPFFEDLHPALMPAGAEERAPVAPAQKTTLLSGRMKWVCIVLTAAVAVEVFRMLYTNHNK